MKKVVSTIACCLLLVVGVATHSFAQEEKTLQKKLGAQIGIVFDEIYVRLEIFREKGAKYFIKIKEQKKAALGIGDLPRSPKMELGVAAEVPEKEMDKQYVELDNPLDYPIYIGASSMATLFSNRAVFYITLILLILIIVRAILIRIKYSA